VLNSYKGPKMKKLLFMIILISAIAPNAYSQWWVSGGNLLWPFGNVTITNDLNVNGAVNGAKYYLFLFSHDGSTGNPSVTDLFNNIGSKSSWTRVSPGLYSTTFSDVTFDDNKAFNSRSVALDNGDIQINYTTYTSGSSLFIQVYNFSTITEYDPTISRLPVSLIYYP